MSQLAIRDTLQNQVSTTLMPLVGVNVAYGNKDFNPKGLSAWCRFSFNPATSDPLGKSKAIGDDERGFIQVSVYVKLNAPDYDNQQLTIIDELKKDFFYGAEIDDVDILEVTLNEGRKVESWWRRDTTINYSSFQSRG